MSSNKKVDVWIDKTSVILRDNLGRQWLAAYIHGNKMLISRIELYEFTGKFKDVFGYPAQPIVYDTHIVDVELFDFGISTQRGLERAALRYINELNYSNA